MNDIESIADRLSFIGNMSAAYSVAMSLNGADCPEAAIILLEGAWKKKERRLRVQLEKDRRIKSTASGASTNAVTNVGRKPAQIPQARDDFLKLPYMERLWMYSNMPDLYAKFTSRRKPWER